jgi:enoyl-CoA hydratase/carnithine racemase
MTQVCRTLRVAPSDKGVLGVMIDVPPMNLIGPELVHDLVGLLGALESDQETRVVVLESADPDYFVPARRPHQGRGVHRRSVGRHSGW